MAFCPMICENNMKSYRVFLLSRTKLLIFFQIREWGGDLMNHKVRITNDAIIDINSTLQSL